LVRKCPDEAFRLPQRSEGAEMLETASCFGSPKPLLQNEFALFLELSLVDLALGEPLFQNLKPSRAPRALRRHALSGGRSI